MEKTYTYYQPEYVSKFKCDGKACKAHCCKRSWEVLINKSTYKKYSHLKPKSAAKEITDHITRLKLDGEDKGYKIIKDMDGVCPFLEDNLCSLQKKYGAEFLPEGCATYPRVTWNLGKYYERSLMLSCPLVAVNVLLETEPLKFETIQVPKKIHDNLGKIDILFSMVPYDLFGKMRFIQETAIGLLQNRNFTINQRLMLLGFYFEKLQNLLTYDEFNKLEQLNVDYKDSTFLQEQVNNFPNRITFDVNEHLQIMSEVLKTLYGTDNLTPHDRKFFYTIVEVFQLQLDETGKISSVFEFTRKYTEMEKAIKMFSQYSSNIFENYLVNEFFLNVYPFKFKGSISYNYGVFLTIYKLMELITFSMSIQHFFKENTLPGKDDLIAIIMAHLNDINHTPSYVNKISECLKGKNNMTGILQSMLQV